MNLFDRTDACLLLEVCKEYEEYIDFLFKEVEEDFNVIQTVHTETLYDYFNGTLSDQYKGQSIDQIKSVFDFRRVVILNNLLNRSSSVVSIILEKLNKIHKKHLVETTQIGLVLPLNANNLLMNRRKVKLKKEELEFLLNDVNNKRNKK